METSDSASHLDDLSVDECWDLVRASPVGRLAVVVNGRPEVFPVNHLVDGVTVVFRTDPGSKLAGLAGQPWVCFETDGLDPDTRSGWSVMVKGRATELFDPEDRRRVAQMPFDYWAPSARPHWIRIEPSEVTGRRLRPG